MMIHGSLDHATQRPCVPIQLRKSASGHPLHVSAIIDTGFSGFIQVPLIFAGFLRLPATGIQIPSTVADGRTVNQHVSPIHITLGPKTMGHWAMLSPSLTVLIGMDFLRRFSLALLVSRRGVSLIDEDILETATKKILSE